MSYFQHHLFFCCNQRPNGEVCCGTHQSQEFRDYAKKRLNALLLPEGVHARVNIAGCLDRCENGPVLVIYPEGVWYTYVSFEDIDEILTSHIVNKKIVKRLQLPNRS